MTGGLQNRHTWFTHEDGKKFGKELWKQTIELLNDLEDTSGGVDVGALPLTDSTVEDFVTLFRRFLGYRCYPTNGIISGRAPYSPVQLIQNDVIVLEM